MEISSPSVPLLSCVGLGLLSLIPKEAQRRRDGLAQKFGPGLWDGEAFYETAGIARVEFCHGVK